MADMTCPKSGQACWMGCARRNPGACYQQAMDALAQRIQEAGEVGPGAAAVTYYAGLAAVGDAAAARRWVATCDLAGGEEARDERD